MNRVRLSVIVLLLLAGGAGASAQAPPVENVTVTATKLREMTEQFVKSSVVATHITGKIARWEKGICPVTAGQTPALTTMITAQVKAIATAVGAPVSANAACTPNIEIVFTTTPQSLLDTIERDDPDYLGFAMTGSDREALAKSTRPVQAWYETETIDLNGMARADSAKRGGAGITMPNFTAFSMPSTSGANRQPLDLPYATYARVTGNHIDDGTHSAFYHIVIIVDSTRLAGQKLGPLADYIAMLALTQLSSLDSCQQMASIINNFAADCERKADGMTEIDTAYLNGLYGMDANKSLLFQQSDIADKMTIALSNGPSHDLAAEPAGTGCTAPERPAIVDGANASLDQLKASIGAAKEFMTLSDAYQDCLGKEMDAQKAQATHDKPFDKDRYLGLVASNQKMKEDVGASVNATVAAYKKAHPGQ
jgi:hypothetical protein